MEKTKADILSNKKHTKKGGEVEERPSKKLPARSHDSRESPPKGTGAVKKKKSVHAKNPTR